MFPAGSWLAPVSGWSSLLTNDLTSAIRAPLAARRISELLRDSATTVVLNEVSACAAAAAGPAVDSISRSTKGARSEAIACLSGNTSTSVALATSMAAMMRPMRRRLSA